MRATVTQRLDSAVMHVSIIQAGTLLARLCRPEVENCIRGLQQYSYAYEECSEQAQEVQRGEKGAIPQGQLDDVGVQAMDLRVDDGMRRVISCFHAISFPIWSLIWVPPHQLHSL